MIIEYLDGKKDEIKVVGETVSIKGDWFIVENAIASIVTMVNVENIRKVTFGDRFTEIVKVDDVFKYYDDEFERMYENND